MTNLNGDEVKRRRKESASVVCLVLFAIFSKRKERPELQSLQVDSRYLEYTLSREESQSVN